MAGKTTKTKTAADKKAADGGAPVGMAVGVGDQTVTSTTTSSTTTPVDTTQQINAINNPKESLQTFTLLDLQRFTREGAYSTNASTDFHLFYVGRDNVHEILKYVLSRVSVSLYLNMFGFDDDELNDILWKQALDPGITMLITLDKSQAAGAHEKKLLDLDRQKDLEKFNTHFVIGQSLTHQISHTKGFVADGKVGAEGSTNWSSSGEGTFTVGSTAVGGPGYKAQNNTQSIFTDPDTINRFQTELIAEHVIAQKQQAAAGGPQKAAAARDKAAAKAKAAPAAG